MAGSGEDDEAGRLGPSAAGVNENVLFIEHDY
jgi:hypothetical protein